jgi:hypothetical protein
MLLILQIDKTKKPIIMTGFFMFLVLGFGV